MGLNLAWVGVQGGLRAAVLERLGLEEVGEASSEMGAKYACAETPDGWLIVVATDRKFDPKAALACLPSEALCVGCEMSETVMESTACAVRCGETLWSVVHDPAKDLTSLDVEGAPPPELAEIRARLEAEQAAEGTEEVDYIFDAPLQLAASVCGYRAGQTEGLEWVVLGPGPSTQGARAPRSLSAAIRAELLPLLQSLGWTLASDRPHLAEPEQIIRRLDGREQTLCFHYGSGPKTYVTVYLWDTDTRTPGARHMVRARVQDPPDRRPLWKRLGERIRPSAPTADPIDEVIERAKDKILAADSFLKTGGPTERIHVEFSGLIQEPETPPTSTTPESASGNR